MRMATGFALLALLALIASSRAQIPRTELSRGDAPARANPTRDQPAPRQPLVEYFRETRINIPLNHPRGNPVLVELYYRANGEPQWRLLDGIRYSRGRPTAERFTFEAPADGSYEFAPRTVFAGAAPRQQLQPELKVVIDTRPPRLDFRVLSGGSGEVIAQWNVEDEHLDPQSFKIEYQTASGQPWTTVSIAPPDAGKPNQNEATWWPRSASDQIVVRAEVSDRARNRSLVSKTLALPKIAARPNTGASGQDPVEPRRTENAVVWPGQGQPAVEGGARESIASPAPVDRSSTADATGQRPTWTPRPKSGVGGRHRDVAPPVAGQIHPPVARQAGRAASTSSSSSSSVAARRYALPNDERPTMTKSRRFQLEYDVDAVGPSGVARVELYRTTDNGASWKLVQTDPDLQSPIEVSVESEGVFGYRIVIVSNNGLAGRKPIPGDQADLWIGVDTTPPTARINSAAYGKGARVGQLDIRWQADDAALGERPVALRFSASQLGPWTTIASGLPNSGQYYWAAGARTPPQIYLRLEVRDAAGNVSTHQLDHPLKMDGLSPRGRIRGFRPIDP